MSEYAIAELVQPSLLDVYLNFEDVGCWRAMDKLPREAWRQFGNVRSGEFLAMDGWGTCGAWAIWSAP